MRIIARLDIKNEFVIKGINFEGLRKIGNPNTIAKKFYNDGIDEIIYNDCVASLYQRNSLEKIVNDTAKDIFVPLTVSGGIRTEEDADTLMKNGADKLISRVLSHPSEVTSLAVCLGFKPAACTKISGIPNSLEASDKRFLILSR